MTQRIAIVGSGIAGLSAAHHLRGQAEVSVFEAADYFGGHTHTVDVRLPSPQGQVTHGVDTGFLVYNERTYPGLMGLFEALGVEVARSDMSFSVQVPGPDGRNALEWNGATLNSVFAQRSNLFKPRFWQLLRDILRFNQLATALAEQQDDASLMQPLADFLQTHRFGSAFCESYLLPMLGCIWSCPTDQMLQFPVATMVRFCHNHGLIQVNNRPQWYTVAGGARHYVEKIIAQVDHAHLNTPVRRIVRDAAGVTVQTDAGAQRFDHVILATHSDQALALLQQPSLMEQSVLSRIRYHPNRAVLHTDVRCMPQRKLAWAAWNYERAQDNHQEHAQVCLHYWLNRLQPLPFSQDVFVSLNPVRPIDAQQVLATFSYAHPVFDLPAIQAQRDVASLQGGQRTWFAGAWMGYGFHEDGYQAGRAVAHAVRAA